MIKTERIGDHLSIEASGCSAYIEVRQCGVSILACDHLSYDVEPASFEPDEAVTVLRAMLREIAGPSIDDVREVWGVAHVDMEVQAEDVFAGHTEAVVCVWDGSSHRCFESKTLREALQSAYDAGVERAAAAVPPA